MLESNPVSNPIVLGAKVDSDVEGMAVDETHYKQMVEGLMYIARPTEVHLKIEKIILRGLWCTHHFLRNLSAEGTISLVYCANIDQVADIMTKPLKTNAFKKLRGALGMCDISLGMCDISVIS
ncbi:hypothetical protein V2J09_022148 [Rumex salicifolius]